MSGNFYGWWPYSPNHRHTSPTRGILKLVSPSGHCKLVLSCIGWSILISVLLALDAPLSPNYTNYIRQRGRSTPTVHYADSPYFFPSMSTNTWDTPLPSLLSWTPSNPDATPVVWGSPHGRLSWSKNAMSPMTGMDMGYSAFPILQLHPSLQPNPINNQLPKIQWDLWQKPTTATYYTSRHISMPLNHNLPATYPEVPKVYIALDSVKNYMLSHWGSYMHVRSKKAVTIGDILEAIYEFFQEPLTDNEYNYFADSHPDNACNIEQGFNQRCAEVPGLVGYEEKFGVRRVDLIGDLNRCWQGLTVQPDGTLQLCFGTPLGSG
jgi:hypothetical protein